MHIPRFLALRATLTDRRGATAIEYGLIAVLVAIAAIAGMRTLGNSVLTLWTGTNAKIDAAPTD